MFAFRSRTYSLTSWRQLYEPRGLLSRCELCFRDDDDYDDDDDAKDDDNDDNDDDNDDDYDLSYKYSDDKTFVKSAT